ncbi:MAG: Crp/Fnr family transcriptional regulator [Dissulfurimicrobium sp.]|uniref:Crp/Fnr family transcriptional regulator n=1 Tax=Dissulfurimicrobium sp. TaxID=2022436 RepID=UPI003D0DD525
MKKFSKGKLIYQEGDAVNILYIVEMGKIEIYKTNSDGKKFTIWFIKPREFFCLAMMLYGVAFANAEAVQNTMVYCLNKKDYEAVINKYPEISARLLQCLAGKMVGYSGLVEKSVFFKAQSRIASILINHHSIDKQGVPVCQLSQNEIMSLAGIARETVSRMLRKFKEEGLVSVSRCNIHIQDMERLKNKLLEGSGSDLF